MNLTEAFKALDNLEEDVFSINDEGIEKLQNFIKNDDSVDELSVYDLELEDEREDTEDCHVGDAVLDCCVCHSKLFKPVSEVIIDDETQVANKGEECPYCYSVDGYKVVGEVQPFNEDETEEVTISINDDVDTDLTEDIDEISVSTDDTEIKVSDKREGCEEEESEDEVAVESVKDKNHLTKKKILIKETRNRPELITKKGSIANLLADHMYELQNIYDVNELKNKVIDLVDNSDIANTKGAKDFKYRVLSQRTADRVLSTIGAYMSGISTRDKEESINRKSRKLGKYVVESDNKDETIGDKLKKYQMWVDYDIKHYGKVSETTQDIIDKEGLQLIKDDHGDYEVSVGHYEAESYKKGCYFKEDIDEVNISSDDIDISIETKEKSCDDCKEETVSPTSEQTRQEIKINNVDKDTTEEVAEEAEEIIVESKRDKWRNSTILKEDWYKGVLITMTLPLSEVEKAVDESKISIPAYSDGEWNSTTSLKVYGFPNSYGMVDKDKGIFRLNTNFYDSDIKEFGTLRDFNKAVREKDLSLFGDTVLNYTKQIKDSLVKKGISVQDTTIELKTGNQSIRKSFNESIDLLTEEIEIDSIDKETIEDAIEECLVESFKNIKFFKSSNIIEKRNRFIVEGIIGFKSGKKKNTSFVFRSAAKNESLLTFKGYNGDLNENVDSIILNCKKKGKNLFTESLKINANGYKESYTSNRRLDILFDIIDDSFPKVDDDMLREDFITEAIRLTSIPGVKRDPSNDFSDDGNRFTAYIYKDTVPISYLKSNGNIYLTIAFHHLPDINYEEYKKFDSYKVADDFNGVSESSYNADVFAKNLELAYNDIVNFRNSVEDVDEDEIDRRIEEINKSCEEYKEKVKNYLNSRIDRIMNLTPIQFKQLQRYVKAAGSRTADYIKDLNQASKRHILSQDINALKQNIANTWNFKYIEELIG